MSDLPFPSSFYLFINLSSKLDGFCMILGGGGGGIFLFPQQSAAKHEVVRVRLAQIHFSIDRQVDQSGTILIFPSPDVSKILQLSLTSSTSNSKCYNQRCHFTVDSSLLS